MRRFPRSAAILTITSALIACNGGDFEVPMAWTCASTPACPQAAIPQRPGSFWDFEPPSSEGLSRSSSEVEPIWYAWSAPPEFVENAVGGRGHALALNAWDSDGISKDEGQTFLQFARAPLSPELWLEGSHTLTTWASLPAQWLLIAEARVQSVPGSVVTLEIPLVSLVVGGCHSSALGLRLTGIAPTAPSLSASAEVDAGPAATDEISAIESNLAAPTTATPWVGSTDGSEVTGVEWTAVGLFYELTSPSASPDVCQVRRVERSISAAPARWGVGSWHHFAAVWDAATQLLSVCEGSQCTAGPQLSTTVPRTPVDGALPFALFGARLNDKTTLDGLLDNVSVHATALSTAALTAAMTDAIATLGTLGEYRWSAWDSAGSTSRFPAACFENSPRKEGVVVEVTSADNSTGGLHALLPAQAESGAWLPVHRYRWATLSAELTGLETYDFSLSTDYDEERCLWHRAEAGKRYAERIDLTRPSWCSCRSCGCTFGVQRAGLRTRWSDDDSRGARLSVCSLEFETALDESLGPAGSATAEASTPSVDASAQVPSASPDQVTPLGGQRGVGIIPMEPNAQSWCWRPITYHHNAEATVANASPTEVLGTLSGEENTVTRLMADFQTDGVLLDLSQCTNIRVTAVLEPGAPLDFVLADRCSSTVEWRLEEPTGSAAPRTYVFALAPASQSLVLNPDSTVAVGSSVRQSQYFEGACPTFEPQRIRYLGWQKQYERAIATDAPATLQVLAVEFVGPSSPCHRFERTHPEEALGLSRDEVPK